MRPKGKRHDTVPVGLGGMFSAGDPSTIPPNTVRSLRNYVIRPDGGGMRFDGRPPFVYDGVDTISGFAVWQDLVNELTKTVAVRSADQKLYTKNTNGQNYGAGVTGLPSSTRLTSWTNFLGKLYMMFDNGAGVPSAVASWDGTNIVTSTFNTTFYSRTITSFIQRLFLTDPRVSFKLMADDGVLGSALAITLSYDMTNVLYSKTNVTASLLTLSTGVKECRIAPTSTATKACWIAGPSMTVAASTSDIKCTWRGDFLGVDGLVDVPVTLELALAVGGRGNTTAYVLGALMYVVAGGSYVLHRCTTAGTTAGAPPVFAATLNNVVADGTAVWTCIQISDTEGYFSIGQTEAVIPANTTQKWTSIFVNATIPARPAACFVLVVLKLFNSSTQSCSSLVPIIVSRQDGLADGDPRKQNYGQQQTVGDFYYPFFNQESSTTSTQNIDAVVWSEIDDPKRILAKNTYPLTEIAGLATAAIVANARYVVWKRKGMWIFKGQADFNEPILPEVPAIHVGCLGPQAVANARDGTTYWIGEQHVYKMVIGTDSTPTEIDTPGMYEEIMSRGSNWVESQSTYNMPLLAIDHANGDVWIYTQKAKIYIYHVATASWSYCDTAGGYEVAAMIFDPIGNRMLVSFGGQSATRFDETSDAQDTIIIGGGTSANITNDLVPRPFELYAPRFEMTLLELGLFHLASILNGSLTLSYSLDRGSTYSVVSGYPVTTWSLTNPRLRLPLAATGPSVLVKLSRVGAGGARNWSISKLDALLRAHRGEISYNNPS